MATSYALEPDTRHEQAGAASTREQGYRCGYVDGYRAATEALARTMRRRDITPEQAVKRVDDHLLQRLYEWRYGRLTPEPPPPFEGESAPAGERPARNPAAMELDYRRGYMDGWDAAVEAFGVLVAGHHTSSDTAVEQILSHISRRLRPWQAGDESAGTRAPLAVRGR